MVSRAGVLAGKWDDLGFQQTPPFRCRWFVSWSEPMPGRIAAYFAGYEGGVRRGALTGGRIGAMARRTGIMCRFDHG